jgi:hypothetical protein
MLCFALAGLAFLTVGAASPAASGPDPYPNVQAWLDSDSITPDAPPGGMVEAGVTFWDTHTHDFAQFTGIYVRMRPGTGNAAPAEGKVQADFPGHVTAVFVVPEGGPGAIEVGVRGNECTAGAGCADVDFPFKFAGTGPPPEAPINQLVTATFLPFVGDIVAGRTFPVTVEAMPRGLYDFSAVNLDSGLVVIARQPGGPEVASAPLQQTGEIGTPFTGHLTLPDTGPIDLSVAIPGVNGGRDQVIDGSTKQVTVIEGGRRNSPAPGASAVVTPLAPAPGDVGIPAIAWVIAIGALIAVVGLVLRRVLADL